MERNVATAILEQLSTWGVKNIYGLVGDDIFFLLDALARQNNINFVHVKHEESAALMASAQAKLTGQPGVCLADGGPGTVHLLNGLADAYMDNAPVLAITGQVARKDIGTNTKQYMDQHSLMRPLISYTAPLTDPAGTTQVLENAWRPAVTGNSVAHISVPMDILSLPCKEKVIPDAPYINTRPASTPEVVRGAANMMNQAKNPVILVGEGGRWAGGLLSELAFRWGAAIITTLAGLGTIDRNHPFYIGGLGHAGSPTSTELLKKADMCLIVGANWWPKQYVPDNIPIVQIDLNPSHIGSTVAASYGVVGDAEMVITQLLKDVNTNDNQQWQDTIQGAISAWLKTLGEETTIQSSPVHPAVLVRALQNSVPDDCIITLDTGDHTVWFGRCFRPTRQRILVSGKWRTMGFGLPAALAAQINYPHHKVVAFVGDGGLTMTMAEFLTAVRYNLPVTVVVMNNASLAMEKNKMSAGGLIPAGTQLHNPDFAGFARDCGGLGFTVENSLDLGPVLLEAVNSGQPTLVDVKTADVPVPGTTMPS